MDDTTRRLVQECPWLSVLTYSDEDFIGILQFVTPQTTSIYAYHRIRPLELRKTFLELGRKWWRECFEEIPIDAWYGRAFLPFRHALLTLATPAVTFVHTPHPVSTESTRRRRSKIGIDEMHRRLGRYGSTATRPVTLERPRRRR